MKKYFGIVILLIASLTQSACQTEHDSTATGSSSQGETTLIVTIDGTDLPATLNGSQAAQDLVASLPDSYLFRTYAAGFDEKIADLEVTLDVSSQNYDHDPKAGDIGYWEPDNRLVFYYGDVDEYAGIHIIGHFDTGDYQELLENQTEDFTVEISLVE